MRLPMRAVNNERVDLHAVMETAGLRRPTLVGWSLGGFIIGLYLLKYGRERTAGINLVDAVTVFSPELEFFTQTFGELLPRLPLPIHPSERQQLRGFWRLVSLRSRKQELSHRCLLLPV